MFSSSPSEKISPLPSQHRAPREVMVAVDRVSKRFGQTAAVEEASFELTKGSFLTILGPSGSGKTTLLRMIAGFLEPSAGEIFVHGRPVSALPPHKRAIGMVFQRLALFPHMTAAENVAYPLKMRRHPPATIPERVEEYLGLVRLQGFGDRRIHALSGGQQQRVAIARALVFQPDLLLLDEPLAALDKKLREEMQLEFRRIQQELGVTTINVTHDQREALVMSDEVIVMDQGRIQQIDTPLATYRAPSNRFVAGFIGLTNFLPGPVRSVGQGSACLQVGELPLDGRCALGEEILGQTAEAAIRAEQLLIWGPDEPRPSVQTWVDGLVQEIVFEGDRLAYQVACKALNGARLWIFDHDPRHSGKFEVGQKVCVGWQAADVLIFPTAKNA